MKTTAMSPSYGLAEVTVVAATIAGIDEEPTLLTADVSELQQGRVTTPTDGSPSTTMVLSGKPAGQLVIVVDPVTFEVHPDRVIGEFWIHGPNVGRGYWGRPEATAETFGGQLADGHPDHLPQGPWMRSGDLGALVDGELLVTGRIKDLIIIDGRNVYPQDIEVSVQEADEVVARNRLAAFSVDTDTGEQVVVVAERHRRADDAGSRLAQIADLARAAVSAQHGLALADFVLVEPDSVPRTSSGKIARRATRTAYLDGTLPRVVPPSGEPA
jgi:fatty acid CoA ligase FadD32